MYIKRDVIRAIREKVKINIGWKYHLNDFTDLNYQIKQANGNCNSTKFLVTLVKGEIHDTN